MSAASTSSPMQSTSARRRRRRERTSATRALSAACRSAAGELGSDVDGLEGVGGGMRERARTVSSHAELKAASHDGSALGSDAPCCNSRRSAAPSAVAATVATRLVSLSRMGAERMWAVASRRGPASGSRLLLTPGSSATKAA